MWTLLILSALLWGLISRYLNLLSLKNKEGYLKQISTYLSLVALKGEAHKREEVESIVFDKISTDVHLIKALIAVAPLLGLLGTVGGMIETFASLGTMEMFKAGGGIAGGISQALLTTQLGLIVAVPGLLFLKVIEKKKRNLMKVLRGQIYISEELNCEV